METRINKQIMQILIKKKYISNYHQQDSQNQFHDLHYFLPLHTVHCRVLLWSHQEGQQVMEEE